MELKKSLLESLERIYGPDQGREALQRIIPVLERFPARERARQRLDQRECVLITYGENLLREDEPPLVTLRNFAFRRFRELFSTIHLLPFCPYSSDDGFSIIDYYRVSPRLGDWLDINALGDDFELMFDFVLNHISSRSGWFRGYLADEPGLQDLAIEVDPSADLSPVVRPRFHPLLTGYTKADGRLVHLWTTFSADQIDLNYRSPEVLARMLDVMLFYVRQGAGILRLDAVAYLWKEPGTSCLHLPQTHELVRLLRQVLEALAPDVLLLSETIVPHAENVGYFGSEAGPEASLVCNYTLPPLLLYSFLAQDAGLLGEWAATLRTPPDSAFLNFTASHDGIGVRPLEAILPPAEVERLIDQVRANGGLLSLRQDRDGSESPYELNITYLDALRQPDSNGQDPLQVERFLASQAIMLALPGVPAVYIHSILGSRNWQEGARLTGRPRSINRRMLPAAEVEAEIDQRGSFRGRIYCPYALMLALRRRQSAFSPAAACRVLNLDRRVFALERSAPDQTLYVLVSLSPRPVTVSGAGHGLPERLRDLLTGGHFDSGRITLWPYRALWLERGDS